MTFPDPSSFDWSDKLALEHQTFVTAKVSSFKNVPASEMWDKVVTEGMKVEVKLKKSDVDSQVEEAYWLANVIKYHGYKILLRYVGFQEYSSEDFWINIASVHHVGWCGSNNKRLIPPKRIGKFTLPELWKAVMLTTGQQSMTKELEDCFVNAINPRFSVGDTVEIVDNDHIGKLRVATVMNKIGPRLHVQYFGLDEDLWCHEDSHLLHKPGWARTVGHPLCAPWFYKPDLLLATDFPKLEEMIHVKVGMVLEVVDPLNLSAICAATIMRVLEHGYIMIRVDTEEDADESEDDWFCYHLTSPYIFPCGYAKQNDVPLLSPFGYDDGTFEWSVYFEACSADPAPIVVEDIPHGFEVGMKLEAVDRTYPELLCVASVHQVMGRLLKIRFDGWSEQYDQWVDIHSPDIYPVGWAEIIKHKLELIPSESTAMPTPVPKKLKFKRKPKTRGRKRKGLGVRKPIATPKRRTRTARKRALTARVQNKKHLKKAASLFFTITKNNAKDIKAVSRKRGRPAKIVKMKSSSDKPNETVICKVEKVPPSSSTSTKNSANVEAVPRKRGRPAKIVKMESSSDKPNETVICKVEKVPPSSSTSTKNSANVEDVPRKRGRPAKVAKMESSSGQSYNDSIIKATRAAESGSLDKGNPSGETNERVLPRMDHPTPNDDFNFKQWSAAQVYEFLRKNEIGDKYCARFVLNMVDGQKFINLSKDQLTVLAYMEFDQGIKIFELIGQLRKAVGMIPVKVGKWNTGTYLF